MGAEDVVHSELVAIGVQKTARDCRHLGGRTFGREHLDGQPMTGPGDCRSPLPAVVAGEGLLTLAASDSDLLIVAGLA